MTRSSMRRAIVLPGGTATQQLEQAVLAEQSGWDGVFVWEAGYGVDAWALLAAIAARTSRVRLGTMLTPLPWRRPWKVASQVATLDELSGGRAVLGVGIGAVDPELPDAGEETDLRTRAEMMDEGIDLIRALWSGAGSYSGRYYRFTSRGSASRMVPIWVVGVWPRPKSMRRVLRCDGIMPQWDLGGRGGGPGDLRELRAWLAAHGARPDLDVVAEGETPADDPAAASAHVTPWAQAGCTWWIENRWQMPDGTADPMAVVRERLAAGPPVAARG